MTDTTQARTANPAAESFAALFEASTTQSDQIQEGDIVSGSVLKVGKDTRASSPSTSSTTPTAP